MSRDYGVGVYFIFPTARPEDAVPQATIAYEEKCEEKDERTDGTRFSLEEEGGQVERHEHDVIIKQGRVERLRY